jgi:hypothetical protein
VHKVDEGAGVGLLLAEMTRRDLWEENVSGLFDQPE